jgi:hypothetical protein
MNNMRKRTNQERILTNLLQFPKTTAELANELGYINTKGIARYNIINKDLDKLVEHGYIESEKKKLEKKPGNTPTLYSIVYDIQILKEMLRIYPYLLESMQRSEFVLETIVNENYSWICNSNDEEYVEQIENLKLLNKKGKESWREKLRLSKEFFRYSLYNNFFDMMKDIKKLAQTSSEYWETNIFELKTTPDSSVILWNTNYRLEMIFKACVTSDILQGKVKEEAIEYLEQRKNKVLDKQIDELKEYYSNSKIAPEFLRGKELTPVENPKLKEIEQEFLDKGGKFI